MLPFQNGAETHAWILKRILKVILKQEVDLEVGFETSGARSWNGSRNERWIWKHLMKFEWNLEVDLETLGGSWSGSWRHFSNLTHKYKKIQPHLDFGMQTFQHDPTQSTFFQKTIFYIQKIVKLEQLIFMQKQKFKQKKY